MGIEDRDITGSSPTIAAPTSGGSSPARPSGRRGTRSGRTGATTAADIVAARPQSFWTDPLGYSYTIADANEWLSEWGYSWRIPTDLELGSAAHRRIQNQLDLVAGRVERGEYDPTWDFDINAEGGLGEYSEMVKEYGPGWSIYGVRRRRSARFGWPGLC